MKLPSPLPHDLFVPPERSTLAVTYRPVTTTDLFALRRGCYPEMPLAHLRARLQHSVEEQAIGRRVHLVAELKGDDPLDPELVGSGQLISYGGKRIEIANLIVAPDARGQGIGTAMIQVLVAIARYAGFPALEIGVLAENERALALYRRLGFRPVRELKVPAQGRAVVLVKNLQEEEE